MAIVEIRATVSHRYYAKRRRADTVYRIKMMLDDLRARGIEPCETLPSAGLPSSDLAKWSRDQLADLALDMHRLYPEEE